MNVSWYDAQDFLTKLSAVDADSSYYLPTEQEWEYAARAGTETSFSFPSCPVDFTGCIAAACQADISSDASRPLEARWIVLEAEVSCRFRRQD